ncbi:unnamed protein product [Cuscuta epithymum]|uniref:Retrotransposon Copia-like N-terminal domain-containing protein n=1 Tax=Cuscuta epithymum TaxID=186058 RepID=A0AAV0DZF6_9ASTE|nr:unnamed protein product [Cuscuta epithymum]CAH9113490.1 unnamed protein product [Cuscuta epithymum]CAH9138084.1 unnamed protein product [Cuscuta epithymum]
MDAFTAASTSSTMAPVSAPFTDAAVVLTSASVSLTEPPPVISSQPGSSLHTAGSPIVTDGPYSLFHTIPSVLPWQPPVIPAAGSLFSTPVPSTAQPLHPTPGSFGSTFFGAPGISRPHDPSLFQSPMAVVSQSISPANNVTQIVTIKLKAVEDYITWRTQFEAFLVSQGVFGFLDGSTKVPPMYTIDFNNHQIINTEYHHWLRVDQTIRSWIFATLTRDVLIDVHELKHSFEIWERLQNRFRSASLARAMTLRRLLSNVKKKENQSMENYLREIHALVSELATINSPVSDKEVLQTTLMGLGPEYESTMGTISLFPDNFPPDILHRSLLEAEQRVLYLRQQNTPPAYQAFGVQDRDRAPHGGRGGRGRGGRGRNGRGRGRGYHQYGQQPGHGQQQSAPQQGQQPGQHHQQGFGQQQLRPPNAGSSSTEGILGAIPPPVVCQICFSAGHSAINCPSRFSPSTAPVLLTGQANEALWYPDTGASAHMTSSEGQNFGGGSSSGNN